LDKTLTSESHHLILTPLSFSPPNITFQNRNPSLKTIPILLTIVSFVSILATADSAEAQLFRRFQRSQPTQQVRATQYAQAMTFQHQATYTSAVPSMSINAGIDSSLPFNPSDIGYAGPGTMRDHLWRAHSSDLQARGISQATLMSMPAAQVQSLHNQFHAAEMMQTSSAQPVTFSSSTLSQPTIITGSYGNAVTGGVQFQTVQPQSTFQFENGNVLNW